MPNESPIALCVQNHSHTAGFQTVVTSDDQRHSNDAHTEAGRMTTRAERDALRARLSQHLEYKQVCLRF